MQIDTLRLKPTKGYNQPMVVDATKPIDMHQGYHRCCSAYSVSAERIISSSRRNDREYLFVISLTCFGSSRGLPFWSCRSSYSSALPADILEVAMKYTRLSCSNVIIVIVLN